MTSSSPRVVSPIVALIVSLFGAPLTLSAQQPPDRSSLEEEMFGAPTSQEEQESAPGEELGEEQDEPAQEALSAERAREATIFVDADAKPASSRIERALLEAEDELALGGLLLMQLNASHLEGTAWKESQLSAPNLLDIYLDARPNERLRAYARGRLLYDYTRPAGAPGDPPQGVAEGDGSDGGALPSALLAPGIATNQRLRAQLDQLWVKFDLSRSVYLTVGRQRIRWGSGRFWNPTDFLNATQINPIALFDQRLGVDLIKVHIPWERLGWNFYAVALLGEADTPRELGGALRGELVWGRNELALSFVARRQRVEGPQPLEPFYAPEGQWPKEGVPLRFGADLSRSLGRLELKLETALTRGELRPFYRGDFSLDLSDLETPQDVSREEEWIAQAVASADVTFEYGDAETLILAAEYFYNQAGYDEADLYLWLAIQGGLRPLYLGRHYAALALLLPSPGALEDASFTLSALANLSDRSALSRLDVSYALRGDLRFNAFVMTFLGDYGEFRFRVEVPPIPGQSDEATVIPAPRLSAGLGLSLDF